MLSTCLAELPACSSAIKECLLALVYICMDLNLAIADTFRSVFILYWPIYRLYYICHQLTMWSILVATVGQEEKRE